MSDFTVLDDPQPEDQRIAHFLALIQKATTVEEVAKILVEAGWGIGPGDPPVEQWPAFRVIVPLLREALSRAASIV
jgi:hypothetical protein